MDKKCKEMNDDTLQHALIKRIKNRLMTEAMKEKLRVFFANHPEREVVYECNGRLFYNSGAAESYGCAVVKYTRAEVEAMHNPQPVPEEEEAEDRSEEEEAEDRPEEAETEQKTDDPQEEEDSKVEKKR